MNNAKITHEGEISRIYSDVIHIRIIQNTACSECHAKTACHISSNQEKIIEVPNHFQSLEIGDKVVLEGSASMGLKAVLYAFVIPLLLMFSVLILLLDLISGEIFASICAVAILIVYYFALYLLKDKFKRKFTFSIKDERL